MLRGLVKRNSTRNSILLIFPAIKLVDYLSSRKQDRGETFEDAFWKFSIEARDNEDISKNSYYLKKGRFEWNGRLDVDPTVPRNFLKILLVSNVKTTHATTVQRRRIEKHGHSNSVEALNGNA